MPSWSDHAIWWHVYPLGFVGAPIRDEREHDVVHRLGRIEGWLDHVVELGANGLLLGPIFASTTHGYDTVDHFAVDPRLGDLEDADRLIAAAHARGIRVVLDGVFNHVGREHPLVHERPELVSGAVFEGHDGLVELDHSSPAVLDLVVDVMTFWLERGVDGWRLDAAYAVAPRFWAQALARMRERFPDAWFLAEVIHGDYAQFVRESTVDSVTQYERWQAVWHGLVDANLFEVSHALGRHDALLDVFVPNTFIGNHDVTRIATAVGRSLVPHALAAQFVVAGIPSIYGGDELGWEGLKEERWGGDDAIRPEFPDDPSAVTSDPEARRVLDLCRALVALRQRNPWLVRARTEVSELANRSVALVSTDGDRSVVALLSVAEVETVSRTGDGLQVVVGDARPHDGGWRLPAGGWAVLEG